MWYKFGRNGWYMRWLCSCSEGHGQTWDTEKQVILLSSKEIQQSCLWEGITPCIMEEIQYPIYHPLEADSLDNGCSEKALRVYKVNIRQKFAFVKRKPTTYSFRGSITGSLRSVFLSLPVGVMCSIAGSLQEIDYWNNSTKEPQRQRPSYKEKLRQWGLIGLGTRNVSGESYQ